MTYELTYTKRASVLGGFSVCQHVNDGVALAEPLSTHFTHFTHCHRQPISPISLTYRVASRLGLAASQLDLAAAQLVVLSVGFRSPRELGKFYDGAMAFFIFTICECRDISGATYKLAYLRCASLESR